jgi:hypothetical protein
MSIRSKPLWSIALDGGLGSPTAGGSARKSAEPFSSCAKKKRRADEARLDEKSCEEMKLKWRSTNVHSAQAAW